MPRLAGAGFRSRLRLVDYATLAHFAILSVYVIVASARVPGWYFYLLAHFGVVALILGLVRLAEVAPVAPVRVVRDIYPLLLYTFMFKEISMLVNIFFPFWFEDHLIHWDFRIFGGHPTVLLQSIRRPWLTELMAFFYWSYYLLFPVAWLIWYLRENKATFYSFMFNLSFTMYVCYTLYLLLTARGPQQTLAYLNPQRDAAGFFDSMVLNIQSTAAISGAAFPSSHVAAVWVMLIFIFKFRTWLGIAFLPLIIGLTVSTVYLHYHYAVDAIAGVLLMCVTYPLGCWIERWFNGRFRQTG